MLNPATSSEGLYPGTPGGAPTAGGQFPYNYPITQQDIYNLAKTNPTVANGIQNQYNELAYLQGHALPITMPNAAYTYLGSPSPTGPLFPNINPEALQYYTSQQLSELPEAYKMSAEKLAADTALGIAAEGSYIAAPVAAALYGLAGAGISGVANPIITYALSGGQATPQELAKSSAQGIVYGGLAGSVMPGAQSVAEGIIPGAATTAAGRAATGALTNLAFTNAYNVLATGQPAGPFQDLFSAGIGAGVGYVGGFIKPTEAAPTEFKTIVGVNPEAENVALNINPDVENVGNAAQLMNGQSYTEVTQKVYNNIFDKLLGKVTTYQYYIPLTEDLLSTGEHGLGFTEDISSPLYVRGADGVLRQVTNIKIPQQLAISELSKALETDFNIANPEEVATETLPELYKAVEEAASKGEGIPFQGKIYNVDEFIKAMQGGAFEQSNLPAIIGKDGQPLEPKEVLNLLFTLKNDPPTDFIGNMWQGVAHGNPAIYSQGTIYSNPSFFDRLLGRAQQDPQATFEILLVYLKNLAVQDSEIPADAADSVAQDTALKLTNNIIALQNAAMNYLTTHTVAELPAGSGIPMLTAGMSGLEAKLFADLVSQGFLNQNGNPVTQSKEEAPAPSGGTQQGNSEYIYIENPDGTVTIQKVVYTSNEQQEQQEIEKTEPGEVENQEQATGATQTTEGRQEQVQANPPSTRTIVTPIPGTDYVIVTDQNGRVIRIHRTKVKGGEKTKEAAPATTAEGAESSQKSAERTAQGQPVRVISKAISVQKTIPAELQKEAEQTTTTTTNPIPAPPTPTRKIIIPLPWPTWPIGAEANYHIIEPEESANIYSPSLLPLLLPGLEKYAEASYSPLTATTTFRPLRNPTNSPLVPGTEPLPQGNAVQYNTQTPSIQGSAVNSYSGLSSLANSPAYSNMVNTIADPATMMLMQNAVQKFNAQSPMPLPQGTSTVPLSPMQNAQNNLLTAQLGSMLNPPAPNPNAPLTNTPPRLSPSIQGRALNPMPLGLSNSMQGSALTNPIPFANLSTFGGGANPAMTSVMGQSIVPTAQQLISSLGINTLLQYLNKVMPQTFNSQTLLSAPKSLILQAIEKLPYDVLLNIFLMLPIQQRANLIMLEGLATTPGEAMMMAQGMYGLIPATMAEAQLNGNIKKRMPGMVSPIAQPTPITMPMPITPAPMPVRMVKPKAPVVV